MLNWTRIRELVRKEFIQLFRDPKNRPILVMLPLVQIIIFGYVVSMDIKEIKVALLDQSHTRESRLVTQTLQGNPLFRITHYPANSHEVDELMLSRKVDVSIKIPPDFSRLIRKGETGSIQVLVDGSSSNMASVRIVYTVQVIDGINRQLLGELNPQDPRYSRVDARIRTWYNPNLDSRNFYVPGIVAVTIMIISLLFTSMSIIREREIGTMEQLIVTPTRPIELILGKIIPYTIISIVQMIVLTAFAVFWFDLPLAGNVVLLFVATCLFMLSTLGIGLFISTISATQQQAMMTTFFFILPFFMLSGFVFPIENMPRIVQLLTYLNPLMYFLVIIRDIFLKGVGFNVFWGEFLGLALIGGVVFVSATLRFHKRLD